MSSFGLNDERTPAGRGDPATQRAGGDMPRLWCPPLTHYSADGQLDRDRIAAHWASMTPNLNGMLVPGSTGEGWEMTAGEAQALIDFAVELAGQLGARLLIGVLRTDVPAMCEMISAVISVIQERTGTDDPLQALKQARVCGFAVCPPRGAELTQDQIRAGLETVLGLGLPTALYQLPQVTGNEMSTAVMAQLAERYANLVLLKDSSGHDRVALEDKGQSGVFLVRGAEGNYAEWLKECGGPYDGLLLSSANCFSSQLKAVVTLLEEGRVEEAKDLSGRLTRVVNLVFERVLLRHPLRGSVS